MEPTGSCGITPTCWNTSSTLSSSQCSTNMPSATRQMSIERISTALPLAGMPSCLNPESLSVGQLHRHAQGMPTQRSSDPAVSRETAAYGPLASAPPCICCIRKG